MTGINDDVRGPSLDEVERRRFDAGPSPISVPVQALTVESGAAVYIAGPATIGLDGDWEMAEGGDADARLGKAWEDAIPCAVPGSVHAALVRAGRIPDPTFGRNQEIARAFSFKTWWMRTRFARAALSGPVHLVFDGVCNKCRVWLNGKELGRHEGQFGRFAFDVTGTLSGDNELIVCLDPIEFVPANPDKGNPANNLSWRKTVVSNNVYGWHYSNCPSIGIWRPVHVDGSPSVRLRNPFVYTRADFSVGIVVEFDGPAGPWQGRLIGTVEGESFAQEPVGFEVPVSGAGSDRRHYAFELSDPKLWWPVDMGEQNLYRMKLLFVPASGFADHWEGTFGVRTVTMAPLPGGPTPDKYDWTFVINGQPHFVKGTGWCTMDPLMDFRRERYERFLTLAAKQHCQMVRGWGSGMVETDEFYDICDRLGIMVMQEWPTAWNSHEEQPPDLLEETVRCATLRLRNRPSLVMYGAGNESSRPQHAVTYMMGRLSVELDGTRPYHTGEPWGGSRHDYGTYWSRRHIDHSLQMTADFWGEWGLASAPPVESVRRYLPADEQATWPPNEDGAFAYHLPVFNTSSCLDRQRQFVSYFADPETCGLERYCIASQLAQVMTLRTCIERARTRWPQCTGSLHYKLNDNFPAVSWSTVDWYGAPKIGHFVVRNAHAPLHLCVLQSRCSIRGAQQWSDVWLFDETNALDGREWRTRIRLLGPDFQVLQEAENGGSGAVKSPCGRPAFVIPWNMAEYEPLFLVADLFVEGALADRTWYFYNFEAKRGCMFDRARTTLSLAADRGIAVVGNTGSVPAMGVAVTRPGHADTFTPEEGFLWLDPGETRRIAVDSTDGLDVEALNAGGTR